MNEQLILIKKSIGKWNKWRESPLVELIRLLYTNLKNADLKNADLKNTILLEKENK